MSELRKAETQSSAETFATAAMGIANRRPARMARIVAASLCGMAAVALVYAVFARMDVVVSAQGKVIPSGKSKVVQPLEAGVVRQIYVRDGQKVKAGDVLIELDPTTTAADRDRLQRDHWEAEAEVQRLTALLDGKGTLPTIEGLPDDIARTQQAQLTSALAEHRAKMAALDAEVARKRADRDGTAASLEQIRASLPLVTKKNDMREELVKTGHIAETGLIETRLELINLKKELALQTNRLAEANAGLNAAHQQRAQAVAEFTARNSAELAEESRKAATAELELVKATQRRDLQILRAPIDGVVQQLAVTTVGGVVTQAQPVAIVVPENTALEVDAQVQNKDIGYVKPGQRVITKVETFDFTRFGYIEGQVQWVGTDAVNDQKLGPIYPVRIRLAEQATPNSVNGRKGTLTPGMSVTADIRVDERRMISYFLSPLLRYKDEALRER
ncbi:HlyD family type I secretion periplasmic adaptor subunit [Cupriavidus oxalaticus]|jgi:hemolysin D|uniref:Membrane fusion protein (MFP) family protein n=1 Tax=Cupriavidus oxalaticus TaxID=96344 RepID=A0A375FPK3_9BURK|nr:HlyD family type I secretion periplasmic adaptor subunit [Cupriavidus oxalaticus]QEZ42868.1 HlyD family type I secretion periplasmic adaptor subunit [Cupriavidus oxalaticus]QRQ83527.1 HlyD family type I secretion periplasmic adaptor subunit [Cupriavidus oxalaticus]QRQ92384.1 HlyD family type I secretion periplasmic adaptor subunit [Cupriavidus oxalaticus]WQD87001.1 HlyD family type I secretion periplasmic adaptor subunit [Cupriavidus oxalaticus]SPC07569.1 RTX toxin membrane fusion protein [